jgi:transposase
MRPMKPYSEDLRVRIVSAVKEESMSKSAAACLFGVSLSSVKRYARMADREECRSRRGRAVAGHPRRTRPPGDYSKRT